MSRRAENGKTTISLKICADEAELLSDLAWMLRTTRSSIIRAAINYFMELLSRLPPDTAYQIVMKYDRDRCESVEQRRE